MVQLRMLSRVSRSVFPLRHSSPGVWRQKRLISQHNAVNSLPQLLNKVIGSYGNHICHPPLSVPASHCFSISSSASSETAENASSDSSKEQVDDNVEDADSVSTKADGHTKSEGPEDKVVSDQGKESGSDSNSQPRAQSAQRRRSSGTKRDAFSDSDSDELSKEELVKLVVEKEGLLKIKQEEVNKLRDKVLRSYADMENVMDRTRRDADNTKKFAIQNFAKSLLDVADNLERASSVVRGSFSKLDASKDSIGAFPLLKTLLEGVEMTEKQLSEVFKKFGVQKFDPMNEPFNPHTHNAVFQIPDGSKPPGVVAAVMKSGYMLYDRVIRPAEVGVTKEIGSEESTQDSEVQTGFAKKGK